MFAKKNRTIFRKFAKKNSDLLMGEKTGISKRSISVIIEATGFMICGRFKKLAKGNRTRKIFFAEVVIDFTILLKSTKSMV